MLKRERDEMKMQQKPNDRLIDAITKARSINQRDIGADPEGAFVLINTLADQIDELCKENHDLERKLNERGKPINFNPFRDMPMGF